MIIFSLRSFKGGEGKYMLVTDETQSQRLPIVRGSLCSASGVVQISRPDEHVALVTAVTVTKPQELIPMNDRSAAWLRDLLLGGKNVSR